MADDRHRLMIGAVGGAALHPLARIVAGHLIGALGDAQPLDADGEPGVVHHREHVFDAAVLLADQLAEGAAVVAIGEDRSRAAMDAQLVLERDGADVVARAELAVGADHDLRHDEQRDALHARRRIGRARQHHMDDVLGHIVVAIGDEDLLAGDAVMLAVLHRAGAQRADVGAGLRLGQVHRAGPAAMDQRRQVLRLLRRRAEAVQQLDGGLGQQRAEAEGHVGAVPHLLHRRSPGPRAGPGRRRRDRRAGRSSRHRRTADRHRRSRRACARRRSPAGCPGCRRCD